MYFQHSGQIWRDFPELVPGVMMAGPVSADVAVTGRADDFAKVAQVRLAQQPESQFPEIQAWRRAFTAMGLKPTQYRCAAESLLRRYRKESALPQVHPLVNLCNAISIAYATPIAVFDVAKVTGGIEVRHAAGDESYLAFSGETEHPAPGEVIFADEAGQVHARRWSNRQSALSAVGGQTSAVLIVAEALHESAAADIPDLLAALAGELAALWPATATSAVLTQSAPRFSFS